MSKSYITVLSIAGSDSIGGAGIQADIKTCAALGVYATTVITAVTAQNSRGVRSWEPVGKTLLADQLDAVFSDVMPDAVKVGMLPDVDSVSCVVDKLQRYNPRYIVVDPVMVSTSGDSLNRHDTLKPLREKLLPLATLVTPNISELEKLSGRRFSKELPLNEVLGALPDYCPNILVKGGDDNEETVTDRLFMKDAGIKEFHHIRHRTGNTHGTGCSLSSAIACFLAQDGTLVGSVESAIRWIDLAIYHGKDITFGSGYGPVNHMFKQDTAKFKENGNNRQ